MKLAQRLASPVGFGIALLFFLLPFVAVSCEAPGLGSVEISYTGVDLATDGKASVDTVGDLGDMPAPPVQDNENAPKPDVQVLAIITMVLLLIGIGVSLAPVARSRVFGAGGMAVLGTAVIGATLLIVTEAVAQSNLSSALRDAAREADNQPGEVPFSLTSSMLDDMVQSRIGFWLSLIAVLLVLLFNAGVLLWPRIRAAAATAPTPPPPPAVEPEREPPQQQ